MKLKHIQWIGDDQGYLRILDQRFLPSVEKYWDCKTLQDVFQAIHCLAVRGAPAIGIAAAYGCVIGHRQTGITQAAQYLNQSRPTAVNLAWATQRMQKIEKRKTQNLLAEAKKIHQEDAQMCNDIGDLALEIFKVAKINAALTENQTLNIMTHCNAGALATGGIGTATAGIYKAKQAGLKIKVYACETRPLLQGARLTSYELQTQGIDVTVICDSMASHAMQQNKIHLVITGADRIARNGDSANKIGTLGHAIAAKHFRLPFYIAAPSSTFDPHAHTGQDIPIEQRDPTELFKHYRHPVVPPNVNLWNPSFDVTPNALIHSIITEKGIIAPVNQTTIQALLPHTPDD